MIDLREGISPTTAASNCNIWIHKIDDLLKAEENSSSAQDRRVSCGMQRAATIPTNLPHYSITLLLDPRGRGQRLSDNILRTLWDRKGPPPHDRPTQRQTGREKKRGSAHDSKCQKSSSEIAQTRIRCLHLLHKMLLSLIGL